MMYDFASCTIFMVTANLLWSLKFYDDGFLTLDLHGESVASVELIEYLKC